MLFHPLGLPREIKRAGAGGSPRAGMRAVPSAGSGGSISQGRGSFFRFAWQASPESP